MTAPKRPVEAVPRYALTPDEAAASLGVSRTFFYEHVIGLTFKDDLINANLFNVLVFDNVTNETYLKF